VEIFLETERLVLRQFTEDDVDVLVQLDGDPDVMHFVTGGRRTSRLRIPSAPIWTPALMRNPHGCVCHPCQMCRAARA
jgi:RimJ/RimL family protein N-acetyltransferase